MGARKLHQWGDVAITLRTPSALPFNLPLWKCVPLLSVLLACAASFLLKKNHIKLCLGRVRLRMGKIRQRDIQGTNAGLLKVPFKKLSRLVDAGRDCFIQKFSFWARWLWLMNYCLSPMALWYFSNELLFKFNSFVGFCWWTQSAVWVQCCVLQWSVLHTWIHKERRSRDLK